MKRFSTMLAGCAIAAAALVTPAAAEATAVNVALMDMSAVASGPMGQGFGLMGSGMGLGMMSPGMTVAFTPHSDRVNQFSNTLRSVLLKLNDGMSKPLIVSQQ